MNRKGFVARLLAVLGVGVAGNGVVAAAYQVPTNHPPPAPLCPRCDGDGELLAIIDGFFKTIPCPKCQLPECPTCNGTRYVRLRKTNLLWLCPNCRTDLPVTHYPRKYL